MKKRLLAALIASAAVLSLAGCDIGGTSSTPSSSTPVNESTPGGADTSSDTPSTPAQTPGTGIKVSDSEGKVFNIYVWNEEFKGFVEKYYKAPEGVTVNFVVNTNEGGVYQQKLDEALLNQGSAAADEKVDLFLAEADYIMKYATSDQTQDVTAVGFTVPSTVYGYTTDAVTDTRNGQVKGVSFQACPSGVIYRRSIAKDLFGTDDPAAVQSKIGTWAKFDDVAAQAKAKGYYITPSYAETYRAFSNNNTVGFQDAAGNYQMPDQVAVWYKQAKDYVEKGYTLDDGVWGDEKTGQMGVDGKTLCFFGPAWYFNFCMDPAHEEGVMGDWGFCVGPAAHFWGGTWMLAAAGSDNPETIADIMGAFVNNEEIMRKLVEKEDQFVNSKPLMTEYANGTSGIDFLGGQNAWTIMAEVADNTVWNKAICTLYDQQLNEKIQECYLPYFQGNASEEDATADFYAYLDTLGIGHD